MFTGPMLFLMVQGAKWLLYSYMDICFSNCVYQKYIQRCKIPPETGWSTQMLGTLQKFQAWLALMCLKRKVEVSYWMLITLLQLFTTFKFLQETYLSLTLILHHFLILLSSCWIEFHVLSLENHRKWQTCCRFLFLSGILKECL